MPEQTFLLIVAVIMCVVFVAVLSFLSAVLFQVVKILKEVRGIMSNIRSGSDALTGDLGDLRSHVKSFILGRMSRGFGSRKKKPASSESNSEPAE